MHDKYLRYSDDVEEIDDDEEETFDKIVAVIARGGEIVREREGHSLRTSHAKPHGLLKGELRVPDGLPEPLRQGLFATARSYPVIVRLAHVPGELLDDRKVSCPRGMALKVFDVQGAMLPVLYMFRTALLFITLLISVGLPFSSVARDVPYVPTPEIVVEKMLEVAKVGPKDVVYDLGSGDGRIVITAAKKYGATGVGVDIDPERVAEAQFNAKAAGVTDKVTFREGDLFQIDLSKATVVTLYLCRASI